MTPIALTALRAAAILAIALAAMPLLRRASAATRRTVLVAAFAAVLVLPLASALLPALHIRGDIAPDRQALAMTSAPDSLVVASALPAAAVGEAAPNLFLAQVPDESAVRVSPVAFALVLWALGAAAVLARLAVGLVRARRLVRSARLVERIDGVEVRVSSAIDTPAVTGLFVPVVLLPRDADEWTAERRRIVLAHELAHVASHDCLATVFAQLAVALHWFDPLVWLAARRLRIERELAADDQVLDDGVLASSYAEHLIAFATMHDRPMPAGALGMADSSQVSQRIRAMLKPHRRTPLGRVRYLLLAIGLGMTAIVACVTPERDPAPAPEVETSTAPTRVQAATIDPRAQAIVEEEIERMNREWSPSAAIVLVLDPRTGNVVAVGHRGGTETTAQLAAARPMVPGSTMKPLVVAAALEEGVITPTDRFDATPGPLSTLTDASPHGVLDVGQILAVSSNIGLAKIFDRLGGTKLVAWEKRFHLAAAPSSIPTGPAGAAFAIGAKMSSTPLEIAAVFATLANGGVYHEPTFAPRRDNGEQVVRAETAARVIALLEGVTAEGGTGKAARVEGVRVAGKTGTARLGSTAGSTDNYSSFVGMAPADAPRYVIFVGAETPRDGGSGGQVAAPVFGRVMTRLLAH